MIILKSRKKLLLALTILLIIVHAYNTIFLSLVISNIIQAAGARSTVLLKTYSINAFIGFTVFLILGLVVARLKALLVNDLNISIKDTLIKDIYKNKNDVNYESNLSLLTNDVKQLETKGIEAEFLIIKLTATFLFAILTAFIAFDTITALAFLIGSMIPTLISLMFKNQVNKASSNWMLSNIFYTNKIKDTIAGLETIKTYDAEDTFIESSVAKATEMEDSLKDMNIKVESVNEYIWMGIMVFSMLIPFILGVMRVINNQVPLESFIGLIYLSNSFRGPSSQVIQLINGHATTKRIKTRYLEANVHTADKSHSEAISFESLKINNLNFSYQNKQIFNNLNLEINQGDKVLITGPTGSGKTTLLKIINQSIKTTDVKYLINDNELSTDNSHLFSFIKQKPAIFNDTLINNITLGNDYTEMELKNALKLAELEVLINEKGYDFIVLSEGINLSAGEIQRIEIARAILSDRKIILADEMTSSLDFKTAKTIRDNLYNLNYTIIEVAHNVDLTNQNYYNKVFELNNLNN